MKKRNLKSLKLNKNSISSLQASQSRGGGRTSTWFTTSRKCTDAECYLSLGECPI